MSDEPKQSSEPAGQAGAGSDVVQGAYRVELPTFEGPLDLLLHLIQQHELDIRDIPIAFVAKKYVEFITLMNSLNIDLASEYLVMAATLAHIKSKTLLPVVPSDQEDEAEEEEDPRAELIRRLLEYQKYKLAGEDLAARPVFGRDVFGRPLAAPVLDGAAPLAPMAVFKLLEAFQGVLSRASVNTERVIDVDRLSITERINQLADLLRVHRRLTFERLFEGQETRAELIVTFLALLEMTRLRLTRLEQAAPLEALFIELAVSDEQLEDQIQETQSGYDFAEAPGSTAALTPEGDTSSVEVPDTERVEDADAEVDDGAEAEAEALASDELEPVVPAPLFTDVRELTPLAAESSTAAPASAQPDRAREESSLESEQSPSYGSEEDI